MIRSVVLVALGGALGAVSRFGVSVLAQNIAGARFPWGTLAANWIGCLFIGVAWSLAAERGALSPGARMFLMVGFLGAFTTFSTYALESLNLVRDGNTALALLNLLANNLAGAFLVLLGFWLGRVV